MGNFPVPLITKEPCMNRTDLSSIANRIASVFIRSQNLFHHNGRIIVVGPVSKACQEGCYVC